MGRFDKQVDQARADETRTRDGIEGQIIVNSELARTPEGEYVVSGGGIEVKSFDRGDAIYRHQTALKEAILKGDITPHSGSGF